MGFVNDAAKSLKNFVLMQSNIERLERSIERQDADIAGLREFCRQLSERLVRVETVLEMHDMARAKRVNPKAITQEKK